MDDGSLTRSPITVTDANNKMLMIFAYDINGNLTTHTLPHGNTVDYEYYMNAI
jgi:hypothetical protein